MSAQEKQKQALQDYKDGKIDELGLAKKLGIPTKTKEEKQIAIQQVRDMTTGGHDYTFSVKTPGKALPFTGGVGIFIKSTRVTSGGKVQIPIDIRKEWGLQDGQTVHWFEKNGDIILVPSTPWRQGKER